MTADKTIIFSAYSVEHLINNYYRVYNWRILRQYIQTVRTLGLCQESGVSTSSILVVLLVDGKIFALCYLQRQYDWSDAVEVVCSFEVE